ncbi:hypothetical protein JCM10207_003671 [Rhodosporidiobolus poonsookiae]
MPTPRWWACYASWAAVTVGVALRINQAAPEPYMDEIFHVPQAQAYCRGDWKYWDGALTTPPGLYLFPALIAHLQRISIRPIPPDLLARLPTFHPCSPSALRGFNLVLSLALPFLYASLLRLLRSSPTPASEQVEKSRLARARDSSADWEALVVSLLPLVHWWSWLYYTDLISATSVLLAWREGLKGRYGRSALLGVTSLLFRQTNIVWVAFIAGQAAISRVSLASRLSAPSRGTVDPSLREASSTDLIRTPLALLGAAIRNPLALFPIIAGYAPVFAVFAAFIRWNGGIVLGDKQNHVVSIHVPQLYYFLVFAGVFFAPQLLSVSRLLRTTKALAGSLSRILLSLVAVSGMSWTISRFTIAHPFLLADNRHYAFYLWRRLINVHPYSRYALAPAYLFTAALTTSALADAATMSLSTAILFVGATAAVLVPTPLLEPRYFILPLLILRLYLAPGPSASPSVRRSQRIRLVLEALLYLAVQAGCVFLFLHRTFYWDIGVGEDGRGLEGRDEREIGRVQRFMW